MKRYFQIIGSIVLFGMLFISCSKDTVEVSDTKVGESRITYFPILTVKGSPYIVIPVGGTYTEPGVSATEAGNVIPVTTTGTINTATPGVYTLNYSAVNKDGFASTGSRSVVVYSTAASAANNDFSGSYARTTNGSVAVWTKLAPGVYSVFNPGGAPGTNLTVIVFNSTGLTIKIPSQRTNDGNITTSASESYTNSTPPQYSWQIVNAGYGPAVRTFVKQ